MKEDIYSMTKSGFHEALRQAKEDAWDEGYDGGYADAQRGYDLAVNPYRKSANAV